VERALFSAAALFSTLFACFLVGHLVILGLFARIPGAGVRLRWSRLRSSRYLFEFVGTEACMLTAVLSLGLVRIAAPSIGKTALVLSIGLAWWELWFYVGHRLLHTRLLYRFHRPHHAAVGVHPSLSFGAFETALLSSGFYAPLIVASRAFDAVSAPTLVIAFAGAYALNVLSHVESAPLSDWIARSPLRHVLNPPRYHAQHHARARGNYGLNAPWFDRLFGTELRRT
jgi:lathosterol oxidase